MRSIHMRTVGLFGLAAACWFAPLQAQMSTAPAKPPKQFTLLNAADFTPSAILPPPPAIGSVVETLEIADLHKLIDGADKARLDQAKWDNDHEDPTLYDPTLGVKLENLPKTWALLTLVQHEADVAADLPKNFYNRTRPFAVDPSLPDCEKPDGKAPALVAGKVPGRSYPSGHATLGYSVGYTLAALLPDRAETILARARDYALSREYCGVHFPSDTEASHVVGTLVAVRLLARPDIAAQLTEARAELSAALAVAEK